MLALSKKWVSFLFSQPTTGMGYQIASIALNDGRRFDRVRIEGDCITRIGDKTEIPFEEAEIERIVVNHGR